MTQTVRTPNGRNSVWIEADYGNGNRGKPRLVTFYKITLTEYIQQIELEGLDEEQVLDIKNLIILFDKRSHCYMVEDNGLSWLFRTLKEARDWAYSRDC